jgi:hypothetical protein
MGIAKEHQRTVQVLQSIQQRMQNLEALSKPTVVAR